MNRYFFSSIAMLIFYSSACLLIPACGGGSSSSTMEYLNSRKANSILVWKFNSGFTDSTLYTTFTLDSTGYMYIEEGEHFRTPPFESEWVHEDRVDSLIKWRQQMVARGETPADSLESASIDNMIDLLSDNFVQYQGWNKYVCWFDTLGRVNRIKYYVGDVNSFENGSQKFHYTNPEFKLNSFITRRYERHTEIQTVLNSETGEVYEIIKRVKYPDGKLRMEELHLFDQKTRQITRYFRIYHRYEPAPHQQ